jgi:penicillin-binding protein 2
LKRYLNTVTSEWFNKRILGAILCVVVVFSILFMRLFYLQIIKGQEFLRLSENNSIRLETIVAPRGLIFDAEGELLVDNRPSFDLRIIPRNATPLEETLRKIARYTNIPEEDLMEKVRESNGLSSYKPVLLKQDIGRDVMAAIEVHKYDLPGVAMNIRPVRHYINGQHAAHLIGYLGEINAKELQNGTFAGCKGGDFIGRFGAEKTYEGLLRGKRGGRQVEVDVRGQVVRALQTVRARPGQNLYLSLDYSLQKKVEELLQDHVGAVVAMDPMTGYILVMASNPTFDQNAFVSGMSREEWNALTSNPGYPMTNRVIQAEYPPASTYKIVTTIAGLEEGDINLKTTQHCPGYYTLGDRVFRCWKKGGHGEVNIIRAIAESCDVFFYKVGEEVGVDKLAKYARMCGLGERTGIGLDNEGKGLVPTSEWKKKRIGESWQKGETLNVSIGQGYNLTTPLQMLVLTSAIANSGTLYQPQIVRRVETADGIEVTNIEPVVTGSLTIHPETMDIVKRGLWEAVNTQKGTASGVKLNQYSISGKTGTAQLVTSKDPGIGETEKEEEISDHFKPHAWFVAYAPSEAPRIAVAVIVEHGEHGSTAAAPIAKELIKTYLEKQERKNRVAGAGDGQGMPETDSGSGKD